MPKQRPTFNTKRPSSATVQAIDEFVVNNEPLSVDVSSVAAVAQRSTGKSPSTEAASKRRKGRAQGEIPSSESAQSRGISRRADGTERRRLSVYLTPSLYKKAKVHAVDLELSLSEWVAQLVQRELESR